MKKSTVFIAAIMVASLISCKKEEMKTGATPPSDPVSKSSDTVRIDSVVYYDASGRVIAPDRIDTRLDYHLLLEPLSSRVGKATYFTSMDAFYAFVKKDESRYKEVVAKLDFIKSIQERAAELGVDWERDEKLPETLTKYIESWREGSYRTTKITGVGLLYDNFSPPSTYGGASTPFATFPRWNLYGFNNRASCVVLTGVTFLWDKKGFRGRMVVTFGFPYGIVPLVGGLNFNDKAESIF